MYFLFPAVIDGLLVPFPPPFLVQEVAGCDGTLLLLPRPRICTEVEDRTEHPFRAKGCFIGINNKKREKTRSEMNPGLRGFAKELEISQGRVAPREISDTSHFWLGQKYHKNNAASSFSALALLFPHSQQGSASQTSSRLRIRWHRVRHRRAAPGADGIRLFLSAPCVEQGDIFGREIR